MDEIKATPEKISGLVALAKRLRQADEFARKPFGYENPPLGMLSNLLGLPAVAATAERMGYGEPLTTGKGMTTRLRPETIEAALAVAPGLPATKGLPVGAAITPPRGSINFGTKLSNVRKELSNNPYAVKRLERAADEVPGLERQFTEQALLSAFTGDNAKVLAAMDPRMFMRLAEHIKNPHEPAIADYMNRIRSGAGAEDVPYLRLGMSEHSGMPLISGHEGRHRSLAMQALETPKTLVRLFPEGAMREPMPRKTHEQFLNALTEKIGNPAKIIPEGRMTFNRQKSNFTETPEFNEYIELKSKKDLYDDLTPEQEAKLLEFKKVMDQPYSVPDPERAIEIPEFFSSGGLTHLR